MEDLIVAPEPYSNGRELVKASITEMRGLYGYMDPYDAARDLQDHDFEPPDGVFLIARIDGRAVACGGYRRFDVRSAEVKRMYTDPSVRGRRVARRVLEALERAAREVGYERVVLETGTLQPHAIALYRSMGYVEMPCYGEYVGHDDSICFEKT